MSFTDGNADLNKTGETKYPGAADSYSVDNTVVGRVWIPETGLILTPPVRVRYEKYPWIEKFEVDGVKAAPAKRTGIGTKAAKGFVKSLSTIWSQAYDAYRDFGGETEFDAEGYFRSAAEYFACLAGDTSKRRMCAKFCGFTENMWREGNEDMLCVCTEVILPVLLNDPEAGKVFEESITAEFRDWLDEQDRDRYY